MGTGLRSAGGTTSTKHTNATTATRGEANALQAELTPEKEVFSNSLASNKTGIQQTKAQTNGTRISPQLRKGAIRASKGGEGFISNISLVAKSKGKWRLIFSFKSFNKFVRYEHFKMESGP